MDQSSSALENLRRHVTNLCEDEKARIEILEMPAQTLFLHSEPSDIVVAGIGVNLMINILDGLFPQGLGEHRLILAPQKNSLPLRAYLRQRGFRLFDETVVKEKGRYREILVIEKDGEEVELMGNRFGNEKDGIARDFHEHFVTFHRTILRQRSEVKP